jgi:protein SCO1/2
MATAGFACLFRFAAALGLMLGVAAAPPAAPEVGHPYRLMSTRGGVVTDRTYLGKVQVVVFGFAYCPDICPTTLAALDRGLAQMGPRRRDVRILFISVDRERDTMALLKRYVAAFAPETVGLTGSKAEIDATVAAFRARYAIERRGGDYLVSHTGLVYLIDRRGRVSKMLPPVTRPDRYAAELTRLVDMK